MLDRKLVREQPEFVRAQAARKGVSAPVDEFLRIDGEWRAAKKTLDDLRAESKRVADSIGALRAAGKMEEFEAARAKTAEMKAEQKDLEEKERWLEEQLREVELLFPNLPHESAPDGKDETENPVVRTWGEKRAEPSRQHQEIAADLKLFDGELGTKISGSRFVVYTGAGAKLLRALVNFMADLQVRQNGYYEVSPPALVLSQSLEGTGNLPKFADDLYKTEGEDLWLIPTAEVPVTNLMRDEILDMAQLPVKLAAYTPCFRREAGAAGKDTRGILRMHQFDKVELVKFVAPETSYAELEELVSDAEDVLQALGLHYRVIELCTGDMGDKAAKIYDLEVWAPGEGRYLEVSSCGNFEAFQARRTNIRFRREPGAAPEFVHVLNGSGLAVPRLMVAVMETYWRDGYVEVPTALVPYMGTDRIEASAASPF